MPQSVTTMLMFAGRAAQALQHYVEVIPGAELKDVQFFSAGEQGAEGSVKSSRLILQGHELRAFDSPVRHEFGFTPAVSLFIDCVDRDEFERCFQGLSKGGQTLMPPGNYGFSRWFGWCNDQFGVSWQVNLP
ncbi:MAG TPA: VOC family protein [Planctomycetaceae bacterium]|nr:VOC family protein [Planctomycetaceae bacterium]